MRATLKSLRSFEVIVAREPRLPARYSVALRVPDRFGGPVCYAWTSQPASGGGCASRCQMCTIDRTYEL